MKNKGFTLVELLAVVVILGIISSITYGIVMNNINKSKKASFEISVKNLITAAKEYVTKNMEDNDFPESGIDVTNDEIELKSNPFVSGIIKRNKDKKIELENVSDGNYCANGTQNNLDIEEGICKSHDNDAPYLKVKIIKIESDNIRLLVKTRDNISGLDKYEIKLLNKDNEEIKKLEYKKNGTLKLINEIIDLNNLKTEEEYKIVVVSTDLTGHEKTEKVIYNGEEIIKTGSIDEPKFSISSGTYATNKKLIITYPKNIKDYIYKYTINDEIKNVTGTSVEIEITEKVFIEAFIEKDGIKVTKNEITVEGIDKEGPKINVTIPNIEKWTSTKKITMNLTDIGVGLALRPYAYDKTKEWTKNQEMTYDTSISDLYLYGRDRLGNISDTYTINGDNIICGGTPRKKCGLLNIDSVEPIINIEIIEGTLIENTKYYKDDAVKIRISIKDKYKLDGQSIDGGSGLNYDELEIKFNEKIVEIENGGRYFIKNEKRQECHTSRVNYGDKENPKFQEVTKCNTITEPIYSTINLKEISKNEHEAIYECYVDSNGVNQLDVSINDLANNKSTSSTKVLIDKQIPTLSIKENPKILGKIEYKFVDNVSAKYGLTGGTTVCDPIETKKTGTYNVTCEAVAKNGRSASVTFEAKHDYAPTYERECVKSEKYYTNENCTFHATGGTNYLGESTGYCICNGTKMLFGHTNCWHEDSRCKKYDNVPKCNEKNSVYNSTTKMCDYK